MQKTQRPKDGQKFILAVPVQGRDLPILYTPAQSHRHARSSMTEAGHLPPSPFLAAKPGDDAERGSPEISTAAQAPVGVTQERGAVVAVHKEPRESCKQDGRSSCRRRLA